MQTLKIWQENDAKITKITWNLKKTQNEKKIHYEITFCLEPELYIQD